MLILWNILVGATISSSTSTTAIAITAVMAFMRATSGYLPATKTMIRNTKTFTVRGTAYRDNLENFPTTDKGCLQVYIYMYSGGLLKENRFSIVGNVYYSIRFNGIQGRLYGIR